MATTLTPPQMAAHMDLSLDLSAAPTSWPKPQSGTTIWNTSLGNWPVAPTRSVSPLEKPPHD
jgi:hypothetical protein